MRIVRGLDYYTGTVFEFIMPEHLEVGSIGGGGRYDNLTTYFTEHKFPGVGGSIGLNRFFSVLIEKNLISTTTNSIDYAIIPLSDNELAFSMQVAKDLRSQGNSVTIILENKKFGDKMKYASKIAKNAIVIGESEVASGTYEVKQFK